jgi:MFS family permease
MPPPPWRIDAMHARTGTPGQVDAAKRATYLAFGCAGVSMASWASCIPEVRDHLRLRPSQLGLVLLTIPAGCLVVLPLTGPLVGRLGSRRAVQVMAVLVASGLAIATVGYNLGVAVLAVGLFLFGVGTGAWDVAMNVQGALLEQRLGRSIMSRFHAGWSLGTVASALIGSALIAAHVPTTVHLGLTAAVLGIGVPLVARWFLPVGDQADASAPEQSALTAWREPRTLLIGVFVLAVAFSEGVGNDWVSVAIIDGHHVSAALGTLGYAIFLVSMTTGRWCGPALLDRFGRVPVVRAQALLAVAGVVLFAFAPRLPLAFAGTVLWGVGSSLGFPVGMSAAADDPARAAVRVSVVGSIGYWAFLGSPPVIGFLGDRFTVSHGLFSVAILLAIGVAASGAVAPPRIRETRAADVDREVPRPM